MSYVDTTLTPSSGYTNINNKQCYDAVAAQLSAHSAWQFIENQDFVSGTTTFTTYVWKCLASASGLPNDFYALFRVAWTNTAGPGLGFSTTLGTSVRIAEGYDSTTHTATKMAMTQSATAQTLAADGTSTSSWVITAAPSATAPNVPFGATIGPSAASTSARLLITVTSDSIVVFQLHGATVVQLYVGAFETLLGSALDPMPIVIGTNVTTNTTASASVGYFATTRHPTLGGTNSAFCFGHAAMPYHATSGIGANFGTSSALLAAANTTNAGTLGLSGDTAAGFWLNVAVARACLSTTGSGTGNTGSTRGGLRGFLKHILAGQLTTHSFGDTFTVDGNPWAGAGATTYGLLDTSS